MRLDKYLKITRIIKRRTISKDIISFGNVLVNHKVAKPATNLKVGDLISIAIGEKKLTIEVVSLDEKLARNNVLELYKVIDSF